MTKGCKAVPLQAALQETAGMAPSQPSKLGLGDIFSHVGRHAQDLTKITEGHGLVGSEPEMSM